ncbi:hypothetical protein [Constantimarinum furrinae]|uniref:Uncharacterized protein n=1 Tax=Constantimarinum furrinae TaxID=2562285 RepID=A0A7G8PR57_9FLAO|nr:hypothetical protein [Constantimarinum furrinae]QNJ96823.1 hypothetical protein ALE3EI_0233 [Constantimarinum furrinae]
MKKALLIVMVVVLGFSVYSFTTNDLYQTKSLEEKILINEDDLIKTIINQDLNKELQKNFVRYFDEVNYVNARSNGDLYYYQVIGAKKGVETSINLKIEKIDIENETYTFIDFTDIKVDEFTQYCFRAIPNTTCTQECIVPPALYCESVLCGVWNGTKCIEY